MGGPNGSDAIGSGRYDCVEEFVREPGVPMSDLDQAFADAQENVKKLTSRPANDELLRLYALFKQGSKGDVEGKRPGRFDMVNRAKYDAWAKVAGTSSADAKQSYIDLVARLTQG